MHTDNGGLIALILVAATAAGFRLLTHYGVPHQLRLYLLECARYASRQFKLIPGLRRSPNRVDSTEVKPDAAPAGTPPGTPPGSNRERPGNGSGTPGNRSGTTREQIGNDPGTPDNTTPGATGTSWGAVDNTGTPPTGYHLYRPGGGL